MIYDEIYEYLIEPGAGSRIRCPHRKILYKYAQGAQPVPTAYWYGEEKEKIK